MVLRLAALLLLMSSLLGVGARHSTAAIGPAIDGKPSTAIGPTAAGRWAIVVGIGDYDSQRLKDLASPRRDAERLARSLVGDCGYKREQVAVLTDAAIDGAGLGPANLRTIRSNIDLIQEVRRTVERARKAGAKSLLFFFAGHGIQDGRSVYLLTPNTDTSDPLAVAASSLPLDLILNYAADAEHEHANPIPDVLLMIDACRTGPDGRSALENPRPAKRTDNQRVAVYYACSSGQSSWEQDGNGLFVGSLVKLLKSGRRYQGREFVDAFNRAVNKTATEGGKEQLPEVYGIPNQQLTESILGSLFNRQFIETNLGATPASARRTVGERWAILVGIGDYESQRLKDLPSPRRDAERLAKSLVSECGYKPQHVTVLTDDAIDGSGLDPARLRTVKVNTHFMQEVRKTIEEARKANARSLLFFFAGHGIQDGQAVYLLTPNTDTSDPVAVAASSLPLNVILNYAADTEHEHANPIPDVLLMIDACTTGPDGKSALENPRPARRTDNQRVAVWYACSMDQSSWSRDGIGFFTASLVRLVKDGKKYEGRQFVDAFSDAVSMTASENGEAQSPELFAIPNQQLTERIIGGFFNR